ncbi:hypothetical protein GL263_09450 [Streptomyces durbertensis]|uniref:Uncharacterized protein n=1 Tax=Streptomyces durbertensis TaxID=2448886 RepID=A0ABR6EFB9_9ACTN|nr:hypothetical protein [Streptomyces durbertensis]MBB1243782.1 hypothetical protein [Streptomyces durbertensis]
MGLTRCDRCGAEDRTVRLVCLIEQNTGPGGSHRACAGCVPHGCGEFDEPTEAGAAVTAR